MNYFNLNEGIDIFHKESKTLKQLGVIDFRFTVFLTEKHFNDHYTKRIPKLEELLGVDLNKGKFINIGKGLLMSRYQDLLTASKFEDKFYPRIKNSSAFVYHYPIELHVNESIHTLDIGVLCTCEGLYTKSAPRKLGKENADFYKDNCKIVQLTKAIERGNLINHSPLFLVKTVAFDLAENSTDLKVFQEDRDKMVIVEHIKGRPIIINIDDDTYKKVKQHVIDNRNLH